MHFGGGCCSILVVLSLFAFGMISSMSSAVQCSSSEESSATCCTAKFEDDFSSTVDGGNKDFSKNPIFWTKSTFLFPYLQLLDFFSNYFFSHLVLLSLLKIGCIIWFLQLAFNLQGTSASMWRVHVVMFKLTSNFSCKTSLSPGIPRWLFGSSVIRIWYCIFVWITLGCSDIHSFISNHIKVKVHVPFLYVFCFRVFCRDVVCETVGSKTGKTLF